MDEQTDHRGRFQAQHTGFCKSEAWARPTPPTMDEGLQMLNLLENKLPPKEKKTRAVPFAEARQYVQNAAAQGGVFVTDRVIKKSWECPKRRDNCRVDVEVIKGSAFHPSSQGGTCDARC